MISTVVSSLSTTAVALRGSQHISPTTAIGVISEIYKGARTADVIEIKGERNVMIPYLKRLSAVVSLEEKRVTVDESVFEEVAVYED